MAGDGFGRLFRFTSWGESHGPALGCVVEGVPPGIGLSEADIQPWLDRRKPGGSRFVTQRQEPDAVEILSGVYEGVTTGTPISLLIRNQDQRSKDYSEIARQFRPGHADFAYWAKYRGIRDPRGGGRSSARETAVRVAAGAIARKLLAQELATAYGDAAPALRIRAALVAIDGDAVDRAAWDWQETENNPFWSPDAAAAARWADVLDAARKAGDSLGAVVEVAAENPPVGLGEPVYDRLDADLAAGLMSINAVKGVEIGAGFAAAAMRGSEGLDAMAMDADGRIAFASNHAGGVLGGISTGQPLVARIALKPTSSILTPRPSIDVDGQAIELRTKGRHDPCVGIRAAPIAEAMTAVVLADHWLRHKAQCLDARARPAEAGFGA